MRLTFGLVGAIAIVLAACGGGGGPAGGGAGSGAGGPADPNTVVIGAFVFEPRLLTVPVGTTVTWRNEHNLPHRVTSGTPDKKDQKFDGELKEKGGTFTFTFTEAGLYEYFCSIHPGMTASVDVD